MIAIRKWAMRALLGSFCLAFPIAGAAAADEASLWKALGSEGHFALMRHALAPGIGDPDEFDIDDCGTQRNLSDEGRDQARRIGDRFKANGIAQAIVMTSQWCRCRETAELLLLGPVTDLPAMNSFFQAAGRRGPQTESLRQWLKDHALDQPLVLVSHQVNISAFTGQFTRSGEMVVMRRVGADGFEVVGTIQTD